MGRKGKTERVPRTRAGGEWTEAAFWGFLRSNLRLMSRKWPPRKSVLLASRRVSQSTNKRLKWEYQCSECKNWFPEKQGKSKLVEVDHLTPCGSLSSWDEFKVFAERLFCEPEQMVVRCKECHQAKTNEERIRTTHEE